MVEKFNEMLLSSVGSDDKINTYLDIKSELNKLIMDINEHSKSNINFKIKDGLIEKVNIKHRYSDKDLLQNNKELFFTALKNIFSPIQATKDYTKYFVETEKKFKEEEFDKVTNFLRKFFEIERVNQNSYFVEQEDKLRFYQEQEVIEVTEKPIKLYASSIYQPSFEFLKNLTQTIELIDSIDIELISNQDTLTRNKVTKIILPLGKGERNFERDSHLEPTMKNLIKNLFYSDNQKYSLNINIIINMVRPLNFQEEIIVKNILRKNGVNATKKINTNPKSITDFDFLMLMSKLKVNL